MPIPFSYSGQELDALAGARNYYRWIIDHFRPHLGPRVVEVGAGIGTFAAALLEHTRVRELFLFEPAENNIPMLRARFAGDQRVQLFDRYFDSGTLPPGSVDAVVMVNVLEHIEDDVAVLRVVREVLAPGGAALLFVPALPAIYGTLDDAFGHFRRYSKPSLGAALACAGFNRVELRYGNLPGVLSWFISGRLFRWRTLSPASVTAYDHWVTPWVARVERVLEPPVGQSLFAVARAS